MCGVVGVIGTQDVNQTLFDTLTVLQHRGQDAAGIITCDEKRFSLRKGNGLVRDVFRSRHMQRLIGNMGIGHVRYPTAGSNHEAEAQPFYVNSPFGIALAHNGNLTNAHELEHSLYRDNFRHINTTSDSEVILNVFAHELQQICKAIVTPDMIFKAINLVHKRCKGGYACVGMIAGVGLIAFRDPYGIRPLIFGQKISELGKEVMVASESVALTSQGYTIIDDVQPGEGIFVDTQGEIHRQVCADKAQLSPCLFEFVYFARPDSIIDKILVYKVRMNIGTKLAEKIKQQWLHEEIDVVIPIPETSRHSALSLANHLQIKYREGFIKNRYIGRTFIMPGQSVRQRSVHQKLSVIEMEFKNKNVLLVDDSIVRGTTSQQIIEMARNAGAKKVYFASASPPIRFPNVYGIDMPSSDELIAFNRTVDEVKTQIGADGLIYLDLRDLIESAQNGNPEIKEFEASVFDGKYITGDERDYIARVALLRNDLAKQKEHHYFNECQIDLHNN